MHSAEKTQPVTPSCYKRRIYGATDAKRFRLWLLWYSALCCNVKLYFVLRRLVYKGKSTDISYLTRNLSLGSLNSQLT